MFTKSRSVLYRSLSIGVILADRYRNFENSLNRDTLSERTSSFPKSHLKVKSITFGSVVVVQLSNT